MTVGCPSFIIRSVFMEQAGKLNIAAQWAQSYSREQNHCLLLLLNADDAVMWMNQDETQLQVT